MFQDTVNQIVRKIFQDKILLGLLIVCLLAVFVGGFNYKQDMQSAQEAGIQPVPASQGTDKTGNYGQDSHLQPDLAVQFVKWWVKKAMDYTPASAMQSHQAAAGWMTAEALKNFDEAFWGPDLAQRVAAGGTVGAFQPIAVQAKAINPDGSIVVGVTGTLVLQMGSRPGTHQIEMDVLVSRANTGLRVTGLHNHLTSLSSSVY